MLLKTSFSYTKKFFQRTLQSFKSRLSGGYQRLPNTSPLFNPFSCSRGRGRGGAHVNNVQPSYGELEKLCSGFADQWGYAKDNSRRRSKKKKMAVASTSQAKMSHEEEIYGGGSFMKFGKSRKVVNGNEIERREEGMRRRRVHEGKRGSEENSCCEGMEEEMSATHLVAQKLRELEMMDMGNVDHVLDIEEVLHYYSRLTCPAYLDMVNKFFMETCSEFFSPTASAGSHHKSRATHFQP